MRVIRFIQFVHVELAALASGAGEETNTINALFALRCSGQITADE